MPPTKPKLSVRAVTEPTNGSSGDGPPGSSGDGPPVPIASPSCCETGAAPSPDFPRMEGQVTSDGGRIYCETCAPHAWGSPVR